MNEQLPNAGRGLSAIPVEDSGSQTAANYRFQYAVTAARCIEALITAHDVIVEWHTDFVVIAKSSSNLVSVKHRDLGRGAWTIASLCAEGGLPTLHARWIAMNKAPTCELITNAGFSSTKNDARRLSQLLHLSTPEAIEPDVRKKLANLLDCNEVELLEFLSKLRMTTTSGDNSTIDGILIEHAVRPALESLGLNSALARDVYRASLDLVRDVASGCITDPEMWAVTPIIDPAQRITRTIAPARLLAALTKANIKLDIAVENGVVQSPSSRLLRKLRAGGVGPTIIAGAPMLRRDWYAVEAAFRDDLPGRFETEVQRVRGAVLVAVMNAENRVLKTGKYGAEMHLDLVGQLAVGMKVELPLSVTDLLGCAYQMTDECTVWWSEKFDASSEAPWVKLNDSA